ncbi:hypothetical protein [Pallidibacillus pasinlerensis]|nr:hypothetical protein [Pallidibacillus pasinlerensis]
MAELSVKEPSPFLYDNNLEFSKYMMLNYENVNPAFEGSEAKRVI